MNTRHLHWTERSNEDLVHRIASDFAVQIAKRMEEKNINQREFAGLLDLSEASVSQLFNNAGNFTLRKMAKFARKLGLKIAIVAYDDFDPQNQNGPINSEIFEKCWVRSGRPVDFFALSETSARFNDEGRSRYYLADSGRRGGFINLTDTGTNVDLVSSEATTSSQPTTMTL